MKRHFRYLLAITLALTLVAIGSTDASAQRDIEVDLSVAPQAVAPGQTVRYEINASVEGNYDISVTRAPDFGPFQVVGRSSSPSFYVRNRQAQRSLKVQYHLQAPSETGTYTIQPPQVTIGSRTLTPNPREVRVTEEARDQPATRQRQATSEVGFVEINLEPDHSPYVGEQITLSYDLYLNQRNRGLRARPAGDPALDDFWIEELGDGVPRRRNLQRRDGQTWQVNTMRSIAIFPLRPGPATVDSMDVTLIRSGFFGGSGEEIPLESEPLQINVRPLPDGAPDTFSETNVGDWELEVHSDSRSARVGGRLSITATITGFGRPGRLATPHLSSTDDFELINTEDDVDQSTRGGVISGTRTFTFHLMPLREGEMELPSVIFSFFDPYNEEYVTHSSDPIGVEIQPGALPASDSDGDGDGDRATEDENSQTDILAELHDILPPESLLSAESPTRSLPWWAYALPALGLLLLVVEAPLSKRFQDHRGPARKRRRIRRKAHALLTASDGATTPESLLKSLRLVLNEGLGTQLGALTVDEVNGALQALEVPAELAEATSKTVAALIAQRYAPGNSQDGLNELEEDTRELIDDLLAWQYKLETRIRDNPPPSAAHSVGLLLVILMTFFAATVPVTTEASETALASAQQASEDKDWRRAADQWALLAAQSSDPTYDYNAGTAAARAGDLGRARLHLEGALANGADTRAVRDNLDRVISAVSRQDASVAAFPPQEVASTGLQHLAPWFIAFGLWLAFLLVLVRRVAGRPESRALLVGLVISSLLFSLITAAGWLYVEEFSRNAELGVVIVESQHLRVAPSHHAATQNNNGALPPGAITRIRQHRDGWFEVEFPSGAAGWLPQQAIGLVSERQ